MTNTWTDPETGAIVTPSEHWLWIKDGPNVKAISRTAMAQTMTDKQSAIRARWKAARDE